MKVRSPYLMDHWVGRWAFICLLVCLFLSRYSATARCRFCCCSGRWRLHRCPNHRSITSSFLTKKLRLTPVMMATEITNRMSVAVWPRSWLLCSSSIQIYVTICLMIYFRCWLITITAGLPITKSTFTSPWVPIIQWELPDRRWRKVRLNRCAMSISKPGPPQRCKYFHHSFSLAFFLPASLTSFSRFVCLWRIHLQWSFHPFPSVFISTDWIVFTVTNLHIIPKKPCQRKQFQDDCSQVDRASCSGLTENAANGLKLIWDFLYIEDV